MNEFPHIYNIELSKQFRLLYSLTEATIRRNFSQDYIAKMLDYLASYQIENGEDLIVEILFMKFLKGYYSNSRSGFPLDDGSQSKSQFHLAFRYFRHPQSLQKDLKNTTSINNIQISHYILYKILKQLYQSYSQFLKFFRNPYVDLSSQSINEKILEITQSKESFVKLDCYYPLHFWDEIAKAPKFHSLIHVIEVGSSSYLFHASACLSYYNRFIKPIFNVENLQFPDSSSIELSQLIKYKYSYMDLLTYNTESDKIINLCCLIYLLVLEDTSLTQLSEICKKLNRTSYAIIFLVYSKYRSESLNEEICNVLLKDGDFLILKHIFPWMIKFKFPIKIDLKELFFVAPLNIADLLSESCKNSEFFNGFLIRQLC